MTRRAIEEAEAAVARERAQYIRERGWKQDQSKGLWEWKHPQLPAYYLLRDAYDLAKAEEKEKRMPERKKS